MSLLATGPLAGVVVEDAGSGMLVVQVVVGEWMVDGAAPLSLTEDDGKEDQEPMATG